MPLKQRVPKLKGFNNPFRVEYQGGQPRRARGARRARPRSPRTCSLAHGLVRKGAFVKVLARGEITRAVRRHGPRRSPRPLRRHHGGRR